MVPAASKRSKKMPVKAVPVLALTNAMTKLPSGLTATCGAVSLKVLFSAIRYGRISPLLWFVFRFWLAIRMDADLARAALNK